MTTLLGLDLRGRRVLVAGGGPVATRRVRALLADGAEVLVVAPSVCDELADLLSTTPAGLSVRARPVRESDLDGAWLVHTATGDPTADAAVCRWAQERRVWCVDASGGRYADAEQTLGTARTAATASAGPVHVGVVSAGDPDPGRSRDVRDAIAALLDSGQLPVRRTRRGPGRVVLVGGGPGPVDLMTVRGRRALAEADVVVADRLGPVSVLEELAPGVEVVDVGKSPGQHPVPQDRINTLLVERARRGQVVVRLKGGDPFVFGRGGEEMQACREAGVPVEVVPGVTSAVAVPAAAGIPVTHRGSARGVAVLAGHDSLDGGLCARLLASEVTVVVLMGVAQLQQFAAQVLASGADAGTPAAVVERGCTPDERVLRSRLDEIGERATEAAVASPAVIVLGEVAAAGLLDGVPEAAAHGAPPASDRMAG